MTRDEYLAALKMWIGYDDFAFTLLTQNTDLLIQHVTYLAYAEGYAVGCDTNPEVD